MIEVSPRVFLVSLPLTGNPLRALNCYIIKGTRRNLVIDVGFDQEEGRETLRRALRELCCDPWDTDVYITHVHEDHIGALQSLWREGCFTNVYMGETEAHYYNHLRRDGLYRSVIQMAHWEGFSPEEGEEAFRCHPGCVYTGGMASLPFTTVREGDIIDLGGFLLHVYDFPGHTMGLTVLHEAKQGLLFCSDHILGKITPNITFWQQNFDALAEYRKNLQRARTLYAPHLFSAHRDNVPDKDKRIDELLRHHHHRLCEIMDWIAQNGEVTVYDTACGMKWDYGGGDFSRFPLTQKWFAAGEAFAHLEHLYLGGNLSRSSRGGVFFYTPVEDSVTLLS